MHRSHNRQALCSKCESCLFQIDHAPHGDRHYRRAQAFDFNDYLLGAKVFNEALAADENARTRVSAELIPSGVRLTLNIAEHLDLSLTYLAIVFAVAFLEHKTTGAIAEYFHRDTFSDRRAEFGTLLRIEPLAPPPVPRGRKLPGLAATRYPVSQTMRVPDN
jgi:hypothetical protein